MKIPLMNLTAQYEQLKPEIDAAIKDVVENSRFILGKETKELEAAVASYCGVKYAVGVASGTDALTLSLKALGIGSGDEVITTPYTFIATAEAVSQVGAKPVFADIDPLTYNIDPADIERRITPKTKAVIAVHLYGNPCDMDAIMSIAKRYGLKIVEDTAQAIGAEYGGKRAGSFGNAGCLSFYPSKNLGAFGDGGMVITNDVSLAEKVRLLRVHGSAKQYYHSVIGYNSRLDNLQAAILKIKLTALERWTEGRIAIARFYDSELKDHVVTPKVQKGCRHVYHLYVVRAGGAKEKLITFLNEKGIESRTYYPVPVHLQECYNILGYKRGDLPQSEGAAEETLALPIFPELTDAQKGLVVDTVKGFFRKR